MPSWDDLRIFLALFEAQSVTRAADALKLSPSTVSRRIGALEAQLGSPLFARTPEGMTPTEAAHAIVPDVRRLEETALRIPQTLEARRDSPRGVVRVSAAPLVCSYVLLPLFAELCAEHDELQIDLVSTTDLADLVRFEVDLALRGVRPSSGDELVAKRVGAIAHGLFASEAYLADRPPPGQDGHAVIGWPEDSAFPEARWLRASLPDVPLAMRVNDMRLHLEAACHGVGLALLPSVLAETHQHLRRVQWPGVAEPEASLFLVGHVATRDSARVRPVWDLINEAMSQSADAESAATLRTRLVPVRS